MLCRDIMNKIEDAYPRQYAMDWDNVGLLAGRDDKEVQRIYIALDATDDVIDAAIEWKADMLVTHHPLIFGGMKKINNQDFIGRRVLRLIRNDISYYAMHTNYDVMGMAELSVEKMELIGSEVLEVTYAEDTKDMEDTPKVGLKDDEKNQAEGQRTQEKRRSEGIGRIAELKTPVTLRECCGNVKNAFRLDSVRLFGDPDSIVKRIAICPGSGKSVIPVSLSKGADVLVTGDIGHHEGIDSVAQGMAIIDAGHYGIEHIFIEDMRHYLKTHTEGIEIIGAPIRHPFMIL